jgi:hypothetical protein
MVRYVLAAAVLKAFSMNGYTRRLVQGIGEPIRAEAEAACRHRLLCRTGEVS